MIHHVSVGSNDLVRARKFYDAVLPVIGLRLLHADKDALHYGVGETTFSVTAPVNGKAASAGNGVHVAFGARRKSMVEAFYRAGLDNGGTSDGPPGPRPEYDANYFGAFLFDPDGNKVEAVTLMAK